MLQNLGVRLTEEEFAELIASFSTRAGDVNYRAFADAIERVFTEKNLERSPTKVVGNPSKTTLMKVATITGGQRDNQLQNLLANLHAICVYYGTDIRSAYKDFDKHNLGCVTRTQFQREFPTHPSLISEDDMMTLQDYYTKNGTIDYMMLHKDVNDYGVSQGYPSAAMAKQSAIVNIDTGDRGENLVTRLRVSFNRTRVRPIDFFKDHDPLRSAVITENQFIRGLSNACAVPKGLRLTASEVQNVVDQYKADGKNGGVRYRDFCADVGGAFVVPPVGGPGASNVQLEQHPTVCPDVVSREDIVQETRTLGPQKEDAVMEVLQRIQWQVATQRIDVWPIFKDVDRGVGRGCFTTGNSVSQFRRLLDNLKLNLVSNQEFDLLVERYQDHQGNVNYHAFCADIDGTTKLQKGSAMYFDRTAYAKSVVYDRDQPLQAMPDSDAVLNRVRLHLIAKRIRINEFFEDNDQLRTGYVTPSQFVRAIDRMFPELTEPEVAAVSERYNVGPAPNSSHWWSFRDDMDKVFTEKVLEREPTQTVTPLASSYQTLISTAGNMAITKQNNPDLRMEVEEVLDFIRSQLQQTRKDFRDMMRDFDPLRRGKITKAQFQQGLSYGEVHLTEVQSSALLNYYKDSAYLVDYRAFLQDLTPSPVRVNLSTQRTERSACDTEAVRAAEIARETQRAPDVGWIVEKIRTKVFKERRRVKDFFEDYDRLNSGRVSAEMFERGLDLAGLGLSPSELKSVADAYASAHEGFVEYLRFSQDVEKAMAPPGLENNPLGNTGSYIPLADIEIAARNRGEDIDQSIRDMLIAKFGDVVRARRLDMLPFFEDYDRINNGCGA